MVPLIINSLQEDLQSRSEHNACLALSTIATIGGKDMSESLAPHVMNLLISTTTPSAVRKKAALCFLRLYRRNSQILQLDNNLLQKFFALLEDHDLGVVNSTIALISEIAQNDPASFELATPRILKILLKVQNLEYSREYMYHSVPHPWVQVRCLRFLKIIPPSQKAHLDQLTQILQKTFNNTEMPRNATENQRNAINAVLFEAISLVIHLDYDQGLTATVVNFLGRFISARETNVRYLGLEAMAHLTQSDSNQGPLLRKYQKIVVAALQESDISLRRRSLELLYNMCDRESSKEILVELLNYLAACDVAIKEELVVKIAILAEKFSQTYAWYVDVILQLIRIAGDYVSDEIWFRVIKIVTNNEDIQEYAARNVFKSLKVEPWHENMVKVGGYILGEFGDLIVNQPGSGPMDQFKTLHSRFGAVSISTRALLLSTYAKFANLFPEIKSNIREILTQHQDHIEVEIQQRACEYLRLTVPNAEQLLQTILEAIPPWDEKAETAAEPAKKRYTAPTDGSSAAKTENGGAAAAAGGAGAGAAVGTGSGLVDLIGMGAPQQVTATATAVSQQGLAMPGGATRSVGQAAAQLSLLDIGTGSQPATTPAAAGAGGFGFGATPTGAGPLTGFSANIGAPEVAPIVGAGVMPGAGPAASAGPESSGVGPTAALGTGLTEEQRASVQTMWRRLCLVSEGVIFQDANLQIGMKSEYNGAEGRVMIYFGNSSTMPLTKFSVVIQNVPYLNIQCGPAPTVIASRAQATQPLKFQVLREFPDSPCMQVSYVNVNKQVTHVVPLPIFLSKFLSPPAEGAAVAGPTFLQKWKLLVGPGMESQEIFPSKVPIDITWVHKVFAQGFKISVLEGVDPLKNNFVLAGTLTLADGPVEVLARLETNMEANVYRITVRSSRSASSEFLKALFVSQLQAGQ
eukprot:TRINITY_DN449_c1_g1_i1.p1 TRINITY_DN449_c1_g1~~TRINITY_DN449_c1_g1_i1.p1  ORF type:complete len:1053 (+),score=287.24 TRINITY_DN449_c1_g1_i1:407-3160(+)